MSTSPLSRQERHDLYRKVHGDPEKLETSRISRTQAVNVNHQPASDATSTNTTASGKSGNKIVKFGLGIVALALVVAIVGVLLVVNNTPAAPEPVPPPNSDNVVLPPAPEDGDIPNIPDIPTPTPPGEPTAQLSPIGQAACADAQSKIPGVNCTVLEGTRLATINSSGNDGAQVRNGPGGKSRFPDDLGIVKNGQQVKLHAVADDSDGLDINGSADWYYITDLNGSGIGWIHGSTLIRQ